MNHTKGKSVDLLHLADQVEAEMEKLHLWSSAQRGVNEAGGAFGADSVTFEEWLQFTFLPNLRKAVATNTLPTKSKVATAAIRNLDGLPGTDSLIDLLSRIDRLIEG